MFKKMISLALLSCTFSVYAGIVISGTRVIYSSDQKVIGVQLKNTGEKPSLVQVWVEDTNKNTQVPFVVTPPVSRMDGKNSQTIRIRHTGENLAQDKETLFYFNVLDIPPKVSDAPDAPKYQAQMRVRSRLKFFYRPAKLAYPVTDAYEKVTWKIIGKELIINNSTPYYITYSGVTVQNAQNQDIEEVKDVDMLAPFSEQRFVLKKENELSQAHQIAWSIINDYGGDYAKVSPLNK